ncbi:MAG TPA: FG-GAP-like repeat-containing protein [Gaiellaceae bacterium]|nr:FG-GAP-like repeat-containing protein [Gaiellaceae bacterium]
MRYPVVLPKLSDPRLHLAATITSLQVIGQVGFHFQVSIAQILLAVGTCALLEMAIALRTQRVILWPASAMLTGNGVAFVLRVPGTAHGDWWTLRGWWIFVGTAAVSLLSKHVIKWRGEHVFNPSNIGLVICFLALGRGRADPLDFWWGPMSAWLAIALAVIVAGGFAILLRLGLLRVALGFWVSFAAGIGVLALTGHAMTARWHLGPIQGFHLWWVLITSPEVLVFLFFMITDPKTAPRAPRARLVYAVSLGLLAAAMIAPTTTEFAAKVALLGALAVVCTVLALMRAVPLPLGRRVAFTAAAVAVGVFAAVAAFPNGSETATASGPLGGGALPPITILPPRGVQSQLPRPIAQTIARAFVTQKGLSGPLGIWLEAGVGQGPPSAAVSVGGKTYHLHQESGAWVVGETPNAPLVVEPTGPTLRGYRLSNVAAAVGLDFRQGSFRFGVTGDTPAMMGGGICWLDYNNDGWLDLFAVNNYTDAQYADWEAKGRPPTSQLFENVHGHFVNVTKSSGVGIPTRGEGCVAADFNGDGYTDLFVTTATDDLLFWNNGNGTFTESARKDGVVSYGWHSGAAVADVNGDRRPDLFVAGYTDLQHPIAGSVNGFPTNYRAIPSELFLNEGNRHFKNVTALAGLAAHPNDHSLGAVFLDVNGDGRPDLYVANDEGPNRLYLNEPGGPLGFHFVDVGAALGVADRNAGMGVAAAANRIFVSNSRGQTNAAYQANGKRFTDIRSQFAPAIGANPAGWGDSWVDLRNNGTLDLVLANGEIPVTSLKKDAVPVQVFVPGAKHYVDAGLLRGLRVNGRGLAAADYDNDGRVDIAVGTVGGALLLLRNTSQAGHWLEVNVAPFSPGAIVTVVGTHGRRQARTVQAGSSYLSSEDPRIHFGLGPATSVRELVVRYPDGTVKRLRDVRADQILTVKR